MVTTNDPNCADRLAVLRSHGSKPKYYHKTIGGNFRLDALQAAIVEVKLRHLDGWTAKRQANAAKYEQLLRQSGLIDRECIRTPRAVQARHVYNQYVIRARNRNDLQVFLKKQGIVTEVYYPVPLHLQECFAFLGYKQGQFPESERAALETLALPIYPELRADEMDYVIECIMRFYTN